MFRFICSDAAILVWGITLIFLFLAMMRLVRVAHRHRDEQRAEHGEHISLNEAHQRVEQQHKEWEENRKNGHTTGDNRAKTCKYNADYICCI